ncbi:vWA domain-containing protein [Beggiatoa leptomitoformis]|uniref:VWA domain-containing protein n=1 Tax=Beggiatoa leptomitoformis TaxID=288004 RepID=A0A2N9YI53_9GAMM|nr:VWA domain-containing protein [Beggiatoa leptomitoformis]ALG67625.1 VWA domain-containing protein [Beggiatoa leptomitoformis]AUI70143.1 VWA domain-containing protein [Beggiatoa leptomitoformis]
MEFTAFEFARPYWLLALIILPFWVVWLFYQKAHYSRLQRYADAHLLPYLLQQSPQQLFWQDKTFWGWILLWTCGILALAQPRWDYELQALFRPQTQLLVVLDLSDSMRVRDLPHARIEQAMQEITELLDVKADIYIGLLVFAGIPHLVAPLTDDYNTVKHLLYELKPDLLPIQGSRFAPALERALLLLNNAPNSKEAVQHILLISDGEFEKIDVTQSLALLQNSKVFLHVLAVGTENGGHIPRQADEHQWVIDADGNIVISKLHSDVLKQLAQVGRGIYQVGNYQSTDTQAILNEIHQRMQTFTAQQATQKVWHERFYLLVIIMMLLVLLAFRQPV